MLESLVLNILPQIFIAFLVYLLGRRDGRFYIIRGKTYLDKIAIGNITNENHFIGGLIYALFAIVGYCLMMLLYFIVVNNSIELIFFSYPAINFIFYALFYRGFIFDLTFIKYGDYPKQFGTTATWDKIYAKIFGKYGVEKKCYAFLVLIIIQNICYYKLS